MEKLIVEKLEIIREEDYQKVKKTLNKKDDYFYEQEFGNFNAIFNATPQIFLNKQK